LLDAFSEIENNKLLQDTVDWISHT